MASERQAKAEATWKRLCSLYGADVMERKFGAKAPPDWIEVIGKIQSIDAVLTDVRAKHPQFPPNLPEFEALAKARAGKSEEPSNIEKLANYFYANYGLTRGIRVTKNQLHGWRVLYDGDVKTGFGFNIVGVVIPADGESPGHRIMMEDLA